MKHPDQAVAADCLKDLRERTGQFLYLLDILCEVPVESLVAFFEVSQYIACWPFLSNQLGCYLRVDLWYYAFLNGRGTFDC